jgi:hypothetical protein
MSAGIPITDPVELAWCAFASEYNDIGLPVKPQEQGVSIASFKAGVEWERAACAELVRAAGCICRLLMSVQDFKGAAGFNACGGSDRLGAWEISAHDPRCSHTLAAAIEARGAAEGRSTTPDEGVVSISRKRFMEILDRNLAESGERLTVRRYNKILTDLGFELED